MKRAIAGLMGVGLIGLGVAFLWWVNAPPRPHGEVILEIPRGMPTWKMARLLASHGVIRHPWQLVAWRIAHPRARLQAGEYRFAEPARPAAVFDRIVRGDVHYYEVLIPEGANRWEVAEAVAALGFIDRREFEQTVADPSLIADLAPEARDLEGYLFPSTYRVTRHATARDLCRMMTGQFRAEWERLGRPKPVHALVTLASLVEKETGVGAERALVASVFRNRLDQGMRLECDPTTIYAARLEGRYRGTIYRSDLDSRHPYNTYQHAGLPPGPIANPGREALEAALRPAVTRYFFFVARPDRAGEHRFSETLAEHERAVKEFRRGDTRQQEGRAGSPAGGKQTRTGGSGSV